MTFGGTVLWNTGLRGPALVFCARILPILVSMAIALWAYRRLGSGALEPIPLISLLATSLSLRLVFEEGLFGYKFVALAVMLILLAIVRGRIRGGLVAWLALATLAFNPIPAGYPSMRGHGATMWRRRFPWSASWWSLFSSRGMPCTGGSAGTSSPGS